MCSVYVYVYVYGIMWYKYPNEQNPGRALVLQSSQFRAAIYVYKVTSATIQLHLLKARDIQFE